MFLQVLACCTPHVDGEGQLRGCLLSLDAASYTLAARALHLESVPPPPPLGGDPAALFGLDRTLLRGGGAAGGGGGGDGGGGSLQPAVVRRSRRRGPPSTSRAAYNFKTGLELLMSRSEDMGPVRSSAAGGHGGRGDAGL